MGQILKQDKIGTLSHSAGNISLTTSTLTIGGQQYTTSSTITRTIATDVTMTANTRYQVYAVVSGGVVVLRISANENSVGPAGFTSWKLVGSFIANQEISVGFGAFLTITGKPTSTVYNAGRLEILSTTGTNPTKPTSAVDSLLMKVDGAGAWLKYSYKHEAITGGLIGSADYTFGAPKNLTFNTTLFPLSTAQNTLDNDKEAACVGHGMSSNTTSQGVVQGFVYSTTKLSVLASVFYTSRDFWSSTYYDLQQTGVGMSLVVPFIAFNEWSDIPIEDR